VSHLLCFVALESFSYGFAGFVYETLAALRQMEVEDSAPAHGKQIVSAVIAMADNPVNREGSRNIVMREHFIGIRVSSISHYST
jgi:hypothetical protein